MNDLIIQTKSLKRQFKTFTAVSDLSLQVPSGSVYGFLGPNGAGKTTTIRMLLGLIKPTAGEIHVFGAKLSEQRSTILRQVGALVEMPTLYPHLSGRENLEVSRRLLNAEKKHIDRVLRIVSLLDAANRPVQQYSLGMRQRLGIAMAMLNEPRLLILDEPTNGLDPAGIHEIRDLIKQMPSEHGMTVFLSSHLLSEIELMATHLGIVAHGKLLFEGTLAELQAQRENELILGVHKPQEAIQLLTQAGWSAVQENGHLRVKAQTNRDVALINRMLVTKGLPVYQLQLQQPSLETMFLDITE
ncbi:MAG: ABC transporter ATP-binding protein [Anaerolineae bacterium]